MAACGGHEELGKETEEFEAREARKSMARGAALQEPRE